MKALLFHAFLSAGLLLGHPLLADPPIAQPAPPPGKEAKPAVAPESKDKKPDADATQTPAASAIPNLDPVAAVTFAQSLSSGLTALIGLLTSPAVFTNSAKAISNLKWNKLMKNHAAYLKSLKDSKDFEKDENKIKAGADHVFSRYLVALGHYDSLIASLAEGPFNKTTWADSLAAVDQDFAELKSLGVEPALLKKIQADWKANRAATLVESWVTQNLETSLNTSVGKTWLNKYLAHQLRIAALDQAREGSDVLIDQWVKRNETRTTGRGPRQKSVMPEKLQMALAALTALKEEERFASDRMVREYNAYVEFINEQLPTDEAKFPELTTHPHEAGKFLVSSDGKTTSVRAKKLSTFFKDKTDCSYAKLVEHSAELGKSGSYRGVPLQLLQAGLPVVSLTAVVGGGYLAIRPYIVSTPLPKPHAK